MWWCQLFTKTKTQKEKRTQKILQKSVMVQNKTTKKDNSKTLTKVKAVFPKSLNLVHRPIQEP